MRKVNEEKVSQLARIIEKDNPFYVKRLYHDRDNCIV